MKLSEFYIIEVREYARIIYFIICSYSLLDYIRVGSTPITLLVISVDMSTSTSIHVREIREYARIIYFYNMLLLAVRLYKDGEHAYKIY